MLALSFTCLLDSLIKINHYPTQSAQKIGNLICHAVFIGILRKYSQEVGGWDFVHGALAVEIPLCQIEWSLSVWQCNKNFSSIVLENGFTEYYFEGSYIQDIDVFH